jgi:hypothetical protein
MLVINNLFRKDTQSLVRLIQLPHNQTFLNRKLSKRMYSGRKITASLGNVTVRGEKDGKSKGGAQWPTVCLSMYSITENIYYSQLSSVAILLQPERNSFHIV